MRTLTVQSKMCARLLLVLAALTTFCTAVDRNVFKQCKDSPFCARLRDSSDEIWEAGLQTTLPNGVAVAMTAGERSAELRVEVFAGKLRVSMDDGIKRHRTELQGDLGSAEALKDGRFGEFAVRVENNQILIARNDVAFMELSDFALETGQAEEDKWKSWTDPQINGNQGLAVKVEFLNSKHLFGIPEHASAFELGTTGENGRFSDPYRLYNLDVFEFELNEPMALYGSVPMMISHSSVATSGVFWNTAAETYVDIVDTDSGRQAHFMSESGAWELFVLPGPTPSDVFRQMAELSGFAALPQGFSLGYHQCRWNYNDEADVSAVDSGFDLHDIPYDVLWLDIEHTDGKKYFTWDSTKFPHPKEMQQNLAGKGRKMVTIVDPHIKREKGYFVHEQAEQLGHYIKDSSGTKDMEGWCWPGSSSYLDFTVAVVRGFWASLFHWETYSGSTPTLYTWNDMNEPSVFNGPEVTMEKTCLHADGVEHRDVHNAFGMLVHQATYEGQLLRSAGSDRPFVLSRAFFAGTQKYGPVWTGDNSATWEHLQSTVPMLLSLGVAGVNFVGADVGGFFGSPDPELLVRWYQAAAFQPFFRGHAHIETKRREPWLFGEQATQMIRTAIIDRYALLPYLYTAFHNSSVSGFPVLRPLWSEFPADPAGFLVDDQHLLGPDLLVKPVTFPGITETLVYFPAGADWYDVKTQIPFLGGQTLAVPTPLSKIPVYQRSGSILVKQERVRRSSALMAKDPYTLVIALDAAGTASGKVYFDDGHSFAYQSGDYSMREFHYADGVLTSTAGESNGSLELDNVIERIVVLGLDHSITKISTADAELEFIQGSSPAVLSIRKPELVVTRDFVITLE